MLLLAGGLVASETIGHVLHLDGGLFGLAALAGGWWWLSQRHRTPIPRLPTTQQAWLERCSSLLDQFQRFEAGQEPPRRAERQKELAELQICPEPRPLDLALVGCQLPAAELRPALAAALRHRRGLRLCWGEPLGAAATWTWPAGVQACDVVLYHLPLPLLAVDLRWLESLPGGQPLWLLVSGADRQDPQAALAPLLSQWPEAMGARLLTWNGEAAALASSLEPLAQWLNREGQALQRRTPLRRLEALHGRWQAELEGLRRAEWRRLLQLSLIHI